MPVAADLGDWSNLAQTIIGGTAVLVAGLWALNRWRFPEASEPDIAITFVDATLTRTLDELIVRFLMRNPYRTGLQTGRWASAIFHIGESPFLRSTSAVIRYQELTAPSLEEVRGQESLELRPRQEIQFTYPISGEYLVDATQLSLIVVFEYIEWRRGWFGPWRRKRYGDFFREFVIDVPEAAWEEESPQLQPDAPDPDAS